MVFLCDKPYTEELEIFSNFSFPLSDFQKYAIEGILKGNHVLVTAHTGSGKTLPAEFAIQHFVQQGKKLFIRVLSRLLVIRNFTISRKNIRIFRSGSLQEILRRILQHRCLL